MSTARPVRGDRVLLRMAMKGLPLVALALTLLAGCSPRRAPGSELTNSVLHDHAGLHDPSGPRGDTTLVARCTASDEVARTRKGAWIHRDSLVRYDVLRVETGCWDRPELVFLFHDSGPTPESGLLLKASLWPFPVGGTTRFWIDTEATPPVIVAYQELSRPGVSAAAPDSLYSKAGRMQETAGGEAEMMEGKKQMSRSTVMAMTGLVLACRVAAGQVIVFSDDFDAGTSGPSWTLFSAGGDYTADFAYDYSLRGIIPAPNASGTTVGLHFTVNNNDANPAKDAVSAYPIGRSFPGPRTLHFDMWLNYNGGAGGGTGSTEFATAGLHHAGDRVVWADNAAGDGLWFACSGEGGDTVDYRAYSGGTLLSVAASTLAAVSANSTDAFFQYLFPSPTYETAGAPGKHWVEALVRYADGVVEWRLNGRLIAIRVDESAGATNLMLGYMDTFTSIANPAVDNFVIYDNVRVEAPDCNANGTPDDQDVAGGGSEDCNANGLPDECESVAPSDYDTDGDVDADDLVALVGCLGGPAAGPAACPALCLAAFDSNGDDDVDLGDFAALQIALTSGVFPVRPAQAVGGRRLVAEVAGLDRTAREQRIQQEVLGGNVPGFVRTFVPIHVSALIGGTVRQATYYVTPDYLAIGTDRDFVRMPMTPLIAQPIADALACLLPTRKMVNDIYAQAAVKLAPSPISPTTTDIARLTTYYRHHETVEQQRAGQPLGLLVGGIKKDVVITPLLATNPGKVAIYGWHQLNGTPIQPLYLGHVDWYVDYSHGIRLVRGMMEVDGVEMSVADVLADPSLHVLLSDEGVVTNPSY